MKVPWRLIKWTPPDGGDAHYGVMTGVTGPHANEDGTTGYRIDAYEFETYDEAIEYLKREHQ